MKKIGLIINPIAGMGGAVGLKGTDNKIIEALEAGAKPRVEEKVKIAFESIEKIFEETSEIHFYALPTKMGGHVFENLRIPFHKIEANDSSMEDDNDSTRLSELLNTSRNDTIQCAQKMLQQGVDLIIFAGGDGTARDIYEAVGDDFPVIGIPAGVKIQSPVFCKNAKATNRMILHWMNSKRIDYIKREVIDLDEEMYVRGKIGTSLYGYLKTVYQPENYQNSKAPSPIGEKASQILIGYDIEEKIKKMDCENKEVVYIFGPGSTNYQIMKTMKLEGSLLGVDVIKSGKMILKDASENEIKDILQNNRGILILTPIGGQGCLLGRGNQQISDQVLQCIDQNDFWIVATKEKIRGLNFKPLTIDLYDPILASDLSGYYKVTTGYHESIMIKVCD